MGNKRTKKHKEKVTIKKQKHNINIFPEQNNTLDNFVDIEKISSKDKVKKIWDELDIEIKALLVDEFNQMHEDWINLLKNELTSSYYLNIKKQIINIENKGKEVLPPRKVRFRCFKTPPSDISVIIVGQDPYPNDADGLAFSSKNIKPSLRKIFDLLEWDLKDKNWVRPKSGSLEKWTKNVLLINSILTVEKGKSRSHENIGWQKFTDRVIKLVGNNPNTVTFLWGKFAKEKASLLKDGFVIKSGHPSLLNVEDRSFDNSMCFSCANEYLRDKKIMIDWSL